MTRSLAAVAGIGYLDYPFSTASEHQVALEIQFQVGDFRFHSDSTQSSFVSQRPKLQISITKRQRQKGVKQRYMNIHQRSIITLILKRSFQCKEV